MLSYVIVCPRLGTAFEGYVILQGRTMVYLIEAAKCWG